MHPSQTYLTSVKLLYQVIERQFFGRSGSSVLNHQYDRRRVDKSPHLGPTVYNDKRNPVILGGLG